MIVAHTYAQEGVFEATLTVTDAQTNEDTQTRSISVRNDQGPGGTINNLSLWLKADAGVIGNPAVSLWEDASELGFDASQNTASSQPAKLASEINFNPALDFDGTNDRLQTQLSINHADLPQVTIIAVYKPDNALSGSVWGEDNYGWDRFLLDDKQNRPQLDQMVSDGQGGNQYISGLYPVNEPVLTTVVYNQGAANASSVHVNGENVRTFTANQSGSSNPMQIGDDGNSIQSFNGKISEVIVFDEVLSDLEEKRLKAI